MDVTRSAVKNARFIIGQINPKIPVFLSTVYASFSSYICPNYTQRTFGDSMIHMSHLDYMVEGEDDLPCKPPSTIPSVEKAIGRLIAENLVENGATLQMGIRLLLT